MIKHTRHIFNKVIDRISMMIRDGHKDSSEYHRLIDLAWATTPDDINRAR
jgi:hypothetical protein